MDKINSPLATYNHNSPDLAYAEQMATEAVNISGAFVTIYIKEPNVDHENVNSVWDEDADPVYRPGITFKSFIKVNPYQFELTRWGVDAPLKITAVFARSELIKQVGERLANIGDIIEVPYNAPQMQGPARFRILTAFNSGMFKYRWLYYSAQCELITGDLSLRVTHQRGSRIR